MFHLKWFRAFRAPKQRRQKLPSPDRLRAAPRRWAISRLRDCLVWPSTSSISSLIRVRINSPMKRDNSDRRAAQHAFDMITGSGAPGQIWMVKMRAQPVVDIVA